MSLVFVFTRCPRYEAYILFQIFRIFVLFRKQSKGFLTFPRLLTTLDLQDHSKDGMSLYICCRLSLKALFIAKVSPRFLPAGKSTLVWENFDYFALSFRSATLRHKVTKTKKSTILNKNMFTINYLIKCKIILNDYK